MATKQPRPLVKVDVTTVLEADVDVITVLKAYKKTMFSDDVYLRGDKLYYSRDEGYHKSEYVEYELTSDPIKVELFQTLDSLMELIRKDTRQCLP